MLFEPIVSRDFMFEVLNFEWKVHKSSQTYFKTLFIATLQNAKVRGESNTLLALLAKQVITCHSDHYPYFRSLTNALMFTHNVKAHFDPVNHTPHRA